MAAIGAVEAQGSAGELDVLSENRLKRMSANLPNGMFNHAFSFDTDRLTCVDKEDQEMLDHVGHWNGIKNKVKGMQETSLDLMNLLQSSTAPLTLCAKTDLEKSVFVCERRTLRIDRAGSTESVATTVGGDSRASAPSSPSRPATPQPTECLLRADSEDSGLGPSPAKSAPSPHRSPLPFPGDDSLLDLSPRTDSGYDEKSPPVVEDVASGDFHFQPISLSDSELTTGSAHFQFLLGSKSCDSSDLASHFRAAIQPKLDDHYPQLDTSGPRDAFECDDSASDAFKTEPLVEGTTKLDDPIFTDTTFDTLLNPQVVLIRSDFAEYIDRPESFDHEENSSSCYDAVQGVSDCTSSNCSQSALESQAGSADDGDCKWLNCHRSADDNTTATDLIDHIRQCHVQNQKEEAKNFVCLWNGCKVYDRPSSSRSWLERHVLLHGGSKPFRCIVDGCRQRFSSELMLQRHVNSHFHRGRAHGHRLLRRRRHKNIRRPLSLKSKDFFDEGIMEHVRHNLFQLSSIDGMVSGGPPAAITFQSTVIGKRIDSTGKTKVLLHWIPEDMLPDSWVMEDDVPSNCEKTIPVSWLPSEKLGQMDSLFTSQLMPRPGKRRRK